MPAMGKYSKVNKDVRDIISSVTDTFDDGVNLFSTERYLVQAQEQYQKCKKICRRVSILILLLCIGVIYVHLRG